MNYRLNELQQILPLGYSQAKSSVIGLYITVTQERVVVSQQNYMLTERFFSRKRKNLSDERLQTTIKQQRNIALDVICVEYMH